jgi:hypothetical protein
VTGGKQLIVADDELLTTAKKQAMRPKVLVEMEVLCPGRH